MLCDVSHEIQAWAIFASEEGHHEHDNDPHFEAWNRQADTYQVAEPFVFGGDTIVSEGP